MANPTACAAFHPSSHQFPNKIPLWKERRTGRESNAAGIPNDRDARAEHQGTSRLSKSASARQGPHPPTIDQPPTRRIARRLSGAEARDSNHDGAEKSGNGSQRWIAHGAQGLERTEGIKGASPFRSTPPSCTHMKKSRQTCKSFDATRELLKTLNAQSPQENRSERPGGLGWPAPRVAPRFHPSNDRSPPNTHCRRPRHTRPRNMPLPPWGREEESSPGQRTRAENHARATPTHRENSSKPCTSSPRKRIAASDREGTRVASPTVCTAFSSIHRSLPDKYTLRKAKAYKAAKHASPPGGEQRRAHRENDHKAHAKHFIERAECPQPTPEATPPRAKDDTSSPPTTKPSTLPSDMGHRHQLPHTRRRAV